MSKNYLKTPFQLPCGVTIKNRLVKSAMTERLSNKNLEPTEKHHHLYKSWAQTGAGLLITGNVMVDPIHRESAGNVYVGEESMLPKLKTWAEMATQNDTQAWVQISHAGRQTSRFLTARPMAPSAVQLHKMGLFGKPRAMTEVDIQELIKRYVKSAQLCQAAGFTGIQFHSAHGYLLSQFLSPITNLRTDQWGGTIENRSRLLLRLVEETRKVVGASFPISVKLNSSDFQNGGFTEEESLQVIQLLEDKIDLLEISGGTYEKLAFFEGIEGVKASTRKREAYFIEFATKLRAVSKIPLLITGGFRSFEFCNQVLEKNELDFVGMARPFITNLKDIADFLEGKVDKLEDLLVRTGIKSVDDSAEGGYYARQLIRIAEGKPLDPNISPVKSSLFFLYHELKKSIQHRMG
ncbi:MAG: NADH:flavin oxidoreductase/NADH oxidase family protein [Saprospiraceae bacterium]|nr:NADH:flavin oxidoreductase/NADH oxidase family protein [Saprospiraceae bacterium]